MLSPPSPDPQNQEHPKSRVSLSLNLKWVCLLLLVVIGVMLFLWKPWNTKANERTIDVVGQATVRALPDEYVFSPQYEFKNSDRAKAIKQLTDQSDKVVAGLKKLGVADSKIKTNASGYKNYEYSNSGANTENTVYALNIRVVVESKDLADKIQNYLLTTDPTGTITPQANFSDAKRKEVESQARAEAAKDARSKADELAKNTGFKLGKVKSLNLGNGFDSGPLPYGVTELANPNPNAPVSDSYQPKQSIQPGENELHYSINVTYYIR